MRLHFTEKQLKTVGNLPYNAQRGESEFKFALEAARSFDGCGISPKLAVKELNGIHSVLSRGMTEWGFSAGHKLAVGGSGRIYSGLVAYALQSKIGRVYHVQIKGLVRLMEIIHCWRFSGVKMAGVDEKLKHYTISDEVPFMEFQAAVASMWKHTPGNERIIFQNADGTPASIFNTPVDGSTNGVLHSIQSSILTSAYETMCCHTVTSMLEVPKSVALLGVGEEGCFILDTTYRNGADITKVFSTMIFPKRYFARLIRFEGTVSEIADTL